MLTDTSGARRGMGKQEFLNRMADSLTAEEQARAAGAGPGALRGTPHASAAAPWGLGTWQWVCVRVARQDGMGKCVPCRPRMSPHQACLVHGPASSCLQLPLPLLLPPPLQLAVYEAAGSRYAELPSELYDVALAYISDAAANGRPEQLERALGALTAAARATPPGATGQVRGGA